MAALLVRSQSAAEVCADADDAAPVADRLELLEHENANLRQLLASVSQILGEMRRAAHLAAPSAEDVEVRDLTEQIASLPVTLMYDQIKDEIEASLAVLGDHFRPE